MNESLLVNTLGHSAGVLIFGIFLYLLIQDRTARRLRGSGKSMLAAALAFAWNLTSLIVLGTPGASTFRDWIVAIGFSVLSLLPAVLFDLSLLDRFRPLVQIGYSLSAVAIALHLAELLNASARFHRMGLRLITIGFGVLTMAAASALVFSRQANRRETTSRLVGAMASFLLAMSFVHLSSEPASQVWSRELAFHHVGIPLALLVLMQDYRFLLLDAFLRFLANVFVAAMFTFAVVESVRRIKPAGVPANPFYQALLLAGACLLLILFAVLRGRVQALLTRLVFRRPSIEGLLASLKTPVRDEATYLAFAADRFGEFVKAEASVAEEGDLDLRRPTPISEITPRRAELERKGIEAIVPLRLSSGGAWHILLGRRGGGRRYLSEDLRALARAAEHAVEQLEQFRESEMRRLVAQAELRALASQIHPHFLFNALNTLYGIIPREAVGARETVLNLADIFRYFLETDRTFLPLEEELRIVRAYLDVERLRLGQKLHVEIDIAEEALQVPIPVLSIQPLVENAIKHGIAPKTEGGSLRLEARIIQGSLRVKVSDTGVGFARRANSTPGVGLDNVTRRLKLCYGHEAALDIQSDSGGSSVSFAIPTGESALHLAEVVQ